MIKLFDEIKGGRGVVSGKPMGAWEREGKHRKKGERVGWSD